MNRFQCKLALTFPRGKDMNGRRWDQEIKDQGHRGQSYIWKPGGDIILDRLSRVDRGMR